MIMEIKSRDETTNLFHSVDMDWRQDGFIFQFAPAFTEEAETTINTLIPHLSYLFPDADVGSYFTDYAEERSQYMIYDPTKKMVISMHHEDETEEIDQEENLIGFTFSPEASQALQRPTTSHQRSAMPNDSNSVSTF